MKKYFVLIMLVSISFAFAQDVNHAVFHYWDMDKWDASHNGKWSEGTDWHDMDFVPLGSNSVGAVYWKLVIGNSSTSYATDTVTLGTIYPYWDDPITTPNDHQLHLPNHFIPTYFELYFFDSYKNILPLQTITNQSINLDNIYLYDKFYYYESKIESFAGAVDWQTGNIDLSAEIRQPDGFYLTVEVNGQEYSSVDEKQYSFLGTSWDRDKVIEDIDISNSWLVSNNHVGQLSIELILDSRMWNDDYYIEYNSDNQTISVDGPIPTTPSISLSGAWGANPILTFSGGGNNVDHYVLKKEYSLDGGQTFNRVLTIDPASSPYTDPEIERARIGGDALARYSVKAVSPSDNESAASNIVSTNGDSMWKQTGEEENNENIKVFALNSNYPNPFNPATQISYQLPKNSFVNLIVYNSLGQEVAQLVNQHQSSGQYSVQFNAASLPSGVYIYRLQASAGSVTNFTSVKKMLLTK